MINNEGAEINSSILVNLTNILISEYYTPTRNSTISNANYLLLPLQITKNSKINILMRNSKCHILRKDIHWVTNPFLIDRGFMCGKILPNDAINTEPSLESDYLEHCYALFKALHLITSQQTAATHNFLKKRTSENIKISEHEAIKIIFSKIIGHLLLVEQLLTDEKSFDNINLSVEYLLKAIKALTEVGGGRSVLKGSTLELLFFCRLFHNLYIQE